MTAPSQSPMAGACDPGFELIHADEDLLVLNKPAGLLCVPGLGPDKQDCLSRRVQQVWPHARIVHRLDMVTSGLVLMAVHAQSQRELGWLFERRLIRKQYIALVHGRPQSEGPDPQQGEIRLPIRIDWLNRPRSIVDPALGRPSHTRWQFEGEGPWPGTSRLVLEPLTGRTHQLRLHLSAIGHPIVGDPLYGPPACEPGPCRVMLHAHTLWFDHPRTHQPSHFVAPVPF